MPGLCGNTLIFLRMESLIGTEPIYNGRQSSATKNCRIFIAPAAKPAYHAPNQAQYYVRKRIIIDSAIGDSPHDPTAALRPTPAAAPGQPGADVEHALSFKFAGRVRRRPVRQHPRSLHHLA